MVFRALFNVFWCFSSRAMTNNSIELNWKLAETAQRLFTSSSTSIPQLPHLDLRHLGSKLRQNSWRKFEGHNTKQHLAAAILQALGRFMLRKSPGPAPSPKQLRQMGRSTKRFTVPEATAHLGIWSAKCEGCFLAGKHGFVPMFHPPYDVLTS